VTRDCLIVSSVQTKSGSIERVTSSPQRFHQGRSVLQAVIARPSMRPLLCFLLFFSESAREKVADRMISNYISISQYFRRMPPSRLGLPCAWSVREIAGGEMETGLRSNRPNSEEAPLVLLVIRAG
jgi:hypothetical protein